MFSKRCWGLMAISSLLVLRFLIFTALRLENMNQTIKLTLEQEFRLREFACKVRQMSLDQAQAFLIDQHRSMLIQKVIFQQLLKDEWNLDADVDLAVI